ncbi:MAG: hypothetical protein J6Y72_05500 [Bacteroidales bacterium]|nr:hypothetical protein [Bacteroidales bacterium]
MKTISTLLLLFSCNMYAQDVVKDIYTQYSLLDKNEYCQRVIEKYKSNLYDLYNIINKGTDYEVANAFGIINEMTDSISIKKIAKGIKDHIHTDSIYYVTQVVNFENSIRDFISAYYVLRINVSENKINVDTTTLNFNLYWINRANPKECRCIFIDGGKVYEDYLWPFLPYRTTRKVIKLVLSRKPFCILHCDDIKDGVLYLVDNTIYIYSLRDKQEYDLMYYMENKYEK